jgi:hypothetical protein
MERLLGLPVRNKIFYVRGPLLGGRHVSFRGLAYGTAESPARYVDRHELAHAVIGQHMPADLQAPTLNGGQSLGEQAIRMATQPLPNSVNEAS